MGPSGHPGDILRSPGRPESVPGPHLETAGRSDMKIRRVISLTVLLSFIMLALSGIMLFLSPQGRIAYWAGWRVFGLTKDQFSAIHTTFMVLFLTVGIWHIVLNWRPITGYLKDRSRKIRILTPESAVALVLTVLFLAGPLTGLFPFRQFLDAGEAVKVYWENSEGAPPWGHAEENALQRFCRGMEDYHRLEHQEMIRIDCEDALVALRREGLAVDGLNQSLLEISEVNGTTPQAVSAIILAVARPMTADEAASALAPPRQSPSFQRPYSGLGRMTLREYAEEYRYDLTEILRLLEEAGLLLDPDEILRVEASRLHTDPEGVISVLNGQGKGGEGDQGEG